MFLFCLVFAMFCARLFICALWSPAGKGLASWLSFVVSSVSMSLSHWYPGSGVVLDCIDSWSLHHYLLLIQWATSVTHHLFRAHIFWHKCWNQTFSVIIYLLTFYLYDDIEKISKSLMRINLQRQMQFWQKPRATWTSIFSICVLR